MTEEEWRGQRPPAELVPPNAPFDEEQRAWLNGFLAGLLGLADSESAPATPGPPPATPAANAAWRDPALPLERRLELSSSETPERRMMSALAQLDCGQCGFSCQGYARALAHGTERDTSLCAPGGRSTARALRSLLTGPAGTSRGVRAWVAGGAAARRARGTDVGPLIPAPIVAAVPRGAPERHTAQRVRVKSQRKLTPADAGSEIREVVLDLTGSEISYRSGDSLAVFPHNDPDLVRALLRGIGARGQELVNTGRGSREVWRCLLESVDITHPAEATLRLFAKAAVDAQEARAISELLEQGVPSDFDLLDLISMSPSARPDLDDLVQSLGVLSPRVYAITSSPSSHPYEAHLAVRVIRAERGGRERKGVASTFLTEGVFKGDDLLAYVHPSEQFVLPEDRHGPMIMLGSGTGIARYRSFLEDLEARGRRGNTWLILGSCLEGDETIYENELKAWARLGVLEHLDVVKVGQRGRRSGPYDVLRKRARRVVSWLERGAAIYACGEGRSGGLSETLVEVLGRHGKMSRNEASDFVHCMRREGRYVEEVY